MPLRTDLNVKKYLLYTLPTTICFLMCQNWSDYLGVLIVYLGTVLNQIMLVASLKALLSPLVGAVVQKSNKKIVLLFVGKLVILFGSLSLGVHLMGKRVIIPLINYVILIFVLVLCGFEKGKRNRNRKGRS